MSTWRCLGLALLVLLGRNAFADSPREVGWQDLAPKPSVADNPFAKLTRDQRLALADIASLRDRKARGEPISELDLADQEFASRRLRLAGVDVDGMLAMRQQIVEQRRAQARAVNPALDGQLVQIPGYMLPLEYTGKLVSEFLLVPWVGACIHTPPPPPNQIVHVRTDRPVAYQGLFQPVRVTGRMAVSASKQAVFVVDGSAAVDVGYVLRASRVEPYAE